MGNSYAISKPKFKAIGYITRNGAVVYDKPKAPEATEGESAQSVNSACEVRLDDD